ncbi:hypothetical protein EUTSA_v10028872mg [Eutrema salsugineum]|uniref:Nucleotide-diphospho-sugar transferase domain-containing protein n=1 Tax=Eutrema salsugineum TaxID=72664 RepID=V4L608_EUTSA|nr:hypothetical protein EUTSA_v10028872mg [Eutrema salsugineum]
MFWTAESMRSTAKDEELVSKLNAALKKHDKKFFLSEILVCAKEDEIDARRRSKIATPECPVTYIKPPDTQLICDGCHDEFRPSFAADKELLIKFLRHAHEHPGSVILTVVASDSSFSWSIGDLVSDGFTVLSAVKERASRVAYASSVVWLWEGMQQEDAPFLSLLAFLRQKHQDNKVLVIAEDYATLYKVNDKPQHLLHILELGYSIMYNDIDMVWLQDPFQLLCWVDLYLLSQAAFPTKGLYFKNETWVKETKGKHVIIHNNYILGFDKKIKRFRHFGL